MPRRAAAAPRAPSPPAQSTVPALPQWTLKASEVGPILTPFLAAGAGDGLGDSRGQDRWRPPPAGIAAAMCPDAEAARFLASDPTRLRQVHDQLADAACDLAECVGPSASLGAALHRAWRPRQIAGAAGAAAAAAGGGGAGEAAGHAGVHDDRRQGVPFGSQALPFERRFGSQAAATAAEAGTKLAYATPFNMFASIVAAVEAGGAAQPFPPWTYAGGVGGGGIDVPTWYAALSVGLGPDGVHPADLDAGAPWSAAWAGDSYAAASPHLARFAALIARVATACLMDVVGYVLQPEAGQRVVRAVVGFMSAGLLAARLDPRHALLLPPPGSERGGWLGAGVVLYTGEWEPAEVLAGWREGVRAGLAAPDVATAAFLAAAVAQDYAPVAFNAVVKDVELGLVVLGAGHLLDAGALQRHIVAHRRFRHARRPLEPWRSIRLRAGAAILLTPGALLHLLWKAVGVLRAADTQAVLTATLLLLTTGCRHHEILADGAPGHGLRVEHLRPETRFRAALGGRVIRVAPTVIVRSKVAAALDPACLYEFACMDDVLAAAESLPPPGRGGCVDAAAAARRVPRHLRLDCCTRCRLVAVHEAARTAELPPRAPALLCANGFAVTGPDVRAVMLAAVDPRDADARAAIEALVPAPADGGAAVPIATSLHGFRAVVRMALHASGMDPRTADRLVGWHRSGPDVHYSHISPRDATTLWLVLAAGLRAPEAEAIAMVCPDR